ncbi:MAG: hypothetical protein M0021_09760 [Clostridia bacterium]|nr:hypothetical protein [Clostridia bacterium]
MNELLQKLNQAGLVDEMGNIILERYPDDRYQAVAMNDGTPYCFEAFFGAIMNDAAIVDKYAALVAADAGKGYTRFFDEWKAKGII